MTMLVIAYIFVWLALFLYVARLHIEQRRLTRGLEMLRSRLEKEDRKPSDF
jgi:hypothetical protein